MVHLTDIAGLDDEAHLGAGLLPDQVVVHRRGEQQRRDRGQLGVGVAVGEHHEPHAVGDHGVHLGEDLFDPLGHRRPAAGDPVQTVNPPGLEARQVAVVVDVVDLGQLVVVDHRERQHHLTTLRRGGLQQVALRADVGAQGGDDLLPDRVQRRVRDLREQLREVVEQQPRPVRDRRDRRVRAHRTDRLGTSAGHRRHQDPQLLLGEAERLLPAQARLVRVHHVLALGQFLQVDDARVQPVGVRLRRRQFALDLLVLDHPADDGVDQEHLARLQPALADHRGRVEVEHPGLGSEHHEAVVGDPEPARAQTVAVQHRADHRTVRETDGGRSVPGLGQVGVVLVERPLVRVHLGVVLPRLRDHHQHRVGQRAAAEVQQFEYLVEGRRVAGTRGADRVQPGQVAGDQVRLEHRLPGPHPVAIAAHGVDLTVVRDQPVGVGQGPGREGVGGEAGVDQADARHDARVLEVGEEHLELAGGEHALVHERAGRQRRKVHVGAVLDPLADTERPPLQHQLVDLRGRQEDLPELRHGASGGGTHHVRDHRQHPPAEHVQALLGGNPLNLRDLAGGLAVISGQEGRSDRVLASRRQCEVDHLTQEAVWDADQDARAVPGVRLGARGAAVVQVAQGGQRVFHDVVAGHAGEGGHEGHPTGVVLGSRVIQAGRRGHGRERCVRCGRHRSPLQASGRRSGARGQPSQCREAVLRGRTSAHNTVPRGARLGTSLARRNLQTTACPPRAWLPQGGSRGVL